MGHVNRRPLPWKRRRQAIYSMHVRRTAWILAPTASISEMRALISPQGDTSGAPRANHTLYFVQQG